MSVPFHKYFCVSGTLRTYFIYYEARKIFPKSQNGHTAVGEYFIQNHIIPKIMKLNI